MIYTSEDDFTRRAPEVVVVKTSTKPRSLQRLKDYYEYQAITPELAQKAIAERLAIVHECDAKGYHTVEDVQMMDYLWNIRNLVVDHILRQRTKVNRSSPRFNIG